MNQLTELRPPDFTDVTKWWIFSNKSLLVCLGGGVIAYLLFKITAMIHLKLRRKVCCFQPDQLLL